jgi:sigma-B regulation protein RsbU (phosphoserine phosphatase)
MVYDHQQHETLSATPHAPSTILLVEDDKISLKFIEAMLKGAGYAIQCAADGRVGFEKASRMHPDLIIMDVVMPNMDGLEACRRLKADEHCRHIPVIFVTSNTDEQTLQAAFDAGGSDYVRKPINRIELLARVNTALNQREMARKLAEEEKFKGVLETAGGICHELNQPLQYMLGAVQLLMMDASGNDILYAQLDAIRTRIEQMGEMTRKLTAITRFRTRKYVGGLDILDIDQSSSGAKDS